MKPKKKQLPWLLTAAMAMACMTAAWLWMRSCSEPNTVGIEHQKTIGVTPEKIRSIRDIGQWEFLSVSDEEFVDTTRRHLLHVDRLARIYYGTMRIGIDLSKLGDDWLQMSGDTVLAKLPAVGLLDDRFIDEARTVSFYESGRWSASDREAMYERARQRMLRYALSPQNLRSAEQNADAQFRQLLRAMGFKQAVITFGE